MKTNQPIVLLFIVMILMATGLSAEEKTSVKPNGCQGPVLCPSYPIYERVNECDYHWHVDVGLLYEQPWMSDMIAGAVSYGTNGYQAGNSAYENAEIFTIEECFDYSLGITAGLGFFMEHDDWFLLADFNWISGGLSSAYDDIGAFYHGFGFFNDQVVNPSVNPPNDYSFDAITYKANLDIYDLSVTLSRGSFHSKCFSFEPFGGVKALWYNGFQQKRYFSADDFGDSTANYLQGTLKYDAWGAGPVFGFNSEYFVVQSTSIFIDSNIGVLYGDINSTTTSLFFYPAVLNNDTQGVAKYTQHFKQPYFVPIRTIIGLKFGGYCLEDKHYIALKVGYDARYVIADNGLDGDTYGGAGTHHIVSFVPTNGYNIATNGLYVDFIWNF